MSGDIEACANDLFDFLVTDGNEHLREQTATMVDAVEKITPDQITQWREEILPGVLAQAEKWSCAYLLQGTSPYQRVHVRSRDRMRAASFQA